MLLDTAGVRSPGRAQFDVDRVDPVGKGTVAFGQYSGCGAPRRSVSGVVILECFNQPGPRHGSEERVVSHVGLELGTDIGDYPESTVPDFGPLGVVQQDEASGCKLFGVIMLEGCPGGSMDRKRAWLGILKYLGSEGDCERCKSGGSRYFVEAKLVTAFRPPQTGQCIQEFRRNLREVTNSAHPRRLNPRQRWPHQPRRRKGFRSCTPDARIQRPGRQDRPTSRRIASANASTSSSVVSKVHIHRTSPVA